MMNKKGILSITQILILLIGILAFSFIVGEIGKSQGIKVSTGIGIVSAQSQCETEGGICAPSCADLVPGNWESSLSTCELGSEDICCAPKIVSNSPLEDSAKIPAKTDEPVRYEVGDTFEVDGQEYKLKEDDINENGQIKEDPTDGLKNWAVKTGVGFGTGKLTSATGTLLKGGKAAKQLLTNIKSAGTYLGPAIGAFIAWGIFKVVFKGDVRNMRTITDVALITGLTGTIVAVSIGSGPIGWLIGAIVLVVTFIIGLFTFQNYSREVYSYIVTAWKAPVGGDYCDKCNDLQYGCTEYQCRSFGKACEFVNEGSINEACIWKDPKNIFPPAITALDRVLISGNYSYVPLSPKYGVKINYNKDSKGCVPPYTSITLGINTTKYADCKIDIERTPSYEEMTAPMIRSKESINEFVLQLPHVATPSVESQQAAGILDYQITNGQAQEFYIRCESANGKSNLDEYIMEFCVQDGPDVFPPMILGTNFLEDSFLQYNQSEAHLEIYTNEPAECKWSFEDLNYNAMQFEMDSCSLSEGDYMFSQFRYGCTGQLEGMKNRVENKVYIRCEDKPWWTEVDKGNRYANEQSHILTLQGTEPLVIDEITVNGKLSGAIIKDSVSTINVKLEAKAKFGAENGKSRCQYEFGGNWINFYNEGSANFVNVNMQRIPLSEGFYNYSVRCFDAAGNSDEDNIEFTLKLDNTPPIAVRAYYDVNNLRIITDEPSTCVYNTNANIGCGYVFDDGGEMTTIGEVKHHVAWESNKKYYIKCKDAFENRPLPGKCSIVVRAFDTSW